MSVINLRESFIVNIKIRKSEPSDAQLIKEIYQCPNAYSCTLQLPHPTVEMWTKRMSNIPDNVHSYVAELDGKVVGNLGLEVCTNHRRRHVASFGMGVKDNELGKGIGKALLSAAVDLADNWLNLKRLELTVYIDNTAAINLYKKFGFVIEGESALYAFRNGDYVSVYHMARLAKVF
ncbi:GNAT family N-acetyltransferase [Vibrio sp. MA40-2]|uniref:GNAT family N-acetyltransferase n=1 Tax=Vibrio sp. MA40-2 TaxID=3391828 RepID=UPI0039A50E2D